MTGGAGGLKYHPINYSYTFAYTSLSIGFQNVYHPQPHQLVL